MGPYFRLTQGSYDRLPHDECYYVPSTNCLLRPTSSVSRGSEARWCRFSAREDTYITWGVDYLMGQVLVLGTFLRAIAHAYCTFVLREVLQVLPRLNDLVTEWFLLLYKQQRKALTVTNVMLHPRAFANIKFMPL